MSSPAQTPAPAGPGGHPALGECVLLKHGEVFLRGRNRELFVQRMHDNLRSALGDLEGQTRVRYGQNVSVLTGEPPLAELVERARRVMGFASVEPAVRVATGEENIARAAITVMERYGRSGSFAVRARRRDKTFPLTSSALESFVGARVQRALGLPVNLTAPDTRLAVEVERRHTYLSWERLPGQGGLPVGSSGRALVLLSGGFDSPVAAYRAMRRGLHCDFVHFSGVPFTNAASLYKAYALARQLNRYQPTGQLHTVALGQAQKRLALAGAGKLQVVGQRRLMVRTASELARRLGAEALVTGDSLGQVASQTLSNLATVEDAATLPMLRPLIGFEKQEIINEAERIGTAEVSVLRDEDCCQLLAPRSAAVRSRLTEVRKLERRLEVEELVDELLEGVRTLRPGEEPEEEGEQPRTSPEADGRATAPADGTVPPARTPAL
ncbi:tRNA uracil 4-sulfurtransferase ThiI [Streptomyces sp. NPDC005438]|uniref:tRNA uracil 4-sulfurtransferase ThiI n=1 Tax=Streptomyces sp. NPDC005438 TaxID=3156880 RepID=UPI0033A5A553